MSRTYEAKQGRLKECQVAQHCNLSDVCLCVCVCVCVCGCVGVWVCETVMGLGEEAALRTVKNEAKGNRLTPDQKELCM